MCAEINDRLAAVVRRKGLPARYKEVSSDAERWELVLEGRKKFAEIADEVSASRKTGSHHRGELVLFDREVIFVKKPRAAFRSLERIDGDDLLEQIAEGVRKPTIRVYAPPAATEAILTKGEIVARLAEKEHTSLSAARHLLDGLADLAHEELAAGERSRPMPWIS